MRVKLRSIKLQSYLLSNFIEYELDFNHPKSKQNIMVLTPSMVADWLSLASSIINVDVDMGSFDDSILFCGTAYDFVKERSEVVEKLSTSLTIFNSIWNAFECLCKGIDIPSLPKKLKKGQISFVDNVVYLIYNEFDSKKNCELQFLKEITHKLFSKIQEIIGFKPNNLTWKNAYTSESGVGIQIVRSIRNSFAHGSVSLPLPEDYSDAKYFNSEIIDLSSRIVLFTIQLVLLSKDFIKYDDQYNYLDQNHPFYEGTDWRYLYSIHVEQNKNDDVKKENLELEF